MSEPTPSASAVSEPATTPAVLSTLGYRHWPRRVRADAWDSKRFSQQWFWFAPLVAIGLFVGVMVALFWVLRQDEVDRQQLALYRDVEWAQQVMRLHLQANQDELTGLAREIGTGSAREADFESQARRIMTVNPEISTIAWVDADRVTRWASVADTLFYASFRRAGERIEDPESLATFNAARDNHQPAYSHPYLGADNDIYLELQIPVTAHGRFMGTVSGIYSANNLLRYVVPREVAQKYMVSVIDEGGGQIASTSLNTNVESKMHYELPFDPPGRGILLRAYAYPMRSSLADNVLVWVVGLLSLFIMWSLWSLMRHTRGRAEAESARDRLFNLSLDILCVMDSAGRLMRLNPAFARVLGIDPDSLQGTSLLDLVHPDDRNATDAELRKLAAGEPSMSFENRCRRLNDDGTVEYRWLVWAFNPDLQAKPANRLLYAVAHDVTLRRTRQQALMAETAFRRAMEDSMLTGMRAFDLQGRITYVNPAFCRMIGYDERELIGAMPPYPYWPRSGSESQRAGLEQILSGRAPASGLEVGVIRKNGTQFDARMYVSPLIDAHGVQTGWMTSMTDITEPKRIRQELAAAQERFTTVLEELDAAVSVYAGGIDGGIDADALLFANRYYRRLFGADAAGHRELSVISALSLPPSANPAPVTPGWYDIDLGPKTNEVYSPLVDKWFEVRQRMIQWVDGRMVQMQVATDITVRKETEQVARQQQERVQLTSRLITMGEMASSLAHELNQPLTAIANYSMGTVARLRSTIARNAAGEDVRIDPDELLEALKKTSAQAERAGKIIRRIREFVKRSEPHRQRCVIRAIVDDAVGFAEIETAKKRIAIRTHIPDQIPDVSADPILIEQVLLNLLKNGAEAMAEAMATAPHPTGTGELRLDVRDTGAQIEFAVTDQGPGIAVAQREKLFEPFFSTKAEGMGMGLNICRSIIEFHHGRLWVENNPHGGCTFRFTLPKNPAPATLTAPATSVASPDNTAPHATPVE